MRAADDALAAGTDDALLALLPDERRAESHRLFRAALDLRDHDVDDVEAGRRFLAAYVAFVHHAEHPHDELVGHAHR